MEIAILTSGNLPVPAVQGGAIENLVDELLEYNEAHQLHEITVYSVLPDVPLETLPDTEVNRYIFIDTKSFWARMKRRLYAKCKGRTFYYNYYIEYFLHEALRDLRKQGFDIVILESRPGYAERVRRVTDAKIVVHLHNDWMSDVDSPAVRRARRYIDKVLTVSDYIRERVNLIADGLRAETVHNGIDLACFADVKARDRRSLGFSDTDVIFVYSGRINRDKGVSELIDAVLKLQQYANLKLLVIGSSFFGPDVKADTFISSLKEKAEVLKDRIVFTGFVPYAEIPSYLKLADVAVIPSIWEDPFPTTVLEALAAGLPIIATQSGGIAEAAGEGSILVEKSGDVVEELRRAMLLLYEDEALRHRMGEQSLLRSKLYDKSIYAKNFFDALVD